jgi:hypothetical protein
MKLAKLRVLTVGTILSIAAAGCGPSKAEQAAKERDRLELEERSRRETEAANKAITERNKRLGRKPPSLDLGVPPVEEKPADKPAAP